MCAKGIFTRWLEQARCSNTFIIRSSRSHVTCTHTSLCQKSASHFVSDKTRRRTLRLRLVIRIWGVWWSPFRLFLRLWSNAEVLQKVIVADISAVASKLLTQTAPTVAIARRQSLTNAACPVKVLHGTQVIPTTTKNCCGNASIWRHRSTEHSVHNRLRWHHSLYAAWLLQPVHYTVGHKSRAWK